MDGLDQEKAKVIADAERDLVRLWRAWRTIHQMCADRVRLFCYHVETTQLKFYDQGYQLSEEETSISLDEFRDRYADSSGAPEYIFLRARCTILRM